MPPVNVPFTDTVALQLRELAAGIKEMPKGVKENSDSDDQGEDLG